MDPPPWGCVLSVAAGVALNPAFLNTNNNFKMFFTQKIDTEKENGGREFSRLSNTPFFLRNFGDPRGGDKGHGCV